MARTALNVARFTTALLLLGSAGWVARFYSGNGPGSHLNPKGEIAPAASGTFTIVTLSDLKARSGVLLNAYDDARANNADVIIVGGDLVQQDSDFEYQYAMRLLSLAPEGIPLFNTIGNHEAWDRDNHHEVAQYRKYFGNEESWFETKGVLFVSLDTSDYHFDADRAARAEKVLRERAASARYRVLLSHVLPQVGKLGKKGHEKELSDQESKLILGLVTSYKIDLLLGGHYHGYAEESYAGALMLLTGGGGATLDDPAAGYHYCRVTLGPGGPTHVKIASSAYGLEWIRYQVLRYWYAFLGPLALLVIVLQLVARRKKT